MSIFASILRSVYKLSGAKKAFALPEDALRKEIEKQNRHRGVFTPTDRKAYYETIAVNGFPCLIVREHPKPSERAILYFFGGGMVIGPDKGDLPVMRKLCRETGCDVWFPFYPLCIEVLDSNRFFCFSVRGCFTPWTYCPQGVLARVA